MQNVESSATTKSKGILVLSWLRGQVETLVQTKLAGLYFPLEKNVVFRPSLLLYAQRNYHKMVPQTITCTFLKLIWQLKKQHY